MVKFLTKISLLFLLSGICFFSACTVDLPGLFVSNDLDVRLTEQDNLTFLNKNGWTAPSFGEEYSFIAVTDVHIEDGDAWGLENLKDVIAGNGDIKFVTVLGDISQFGAEEDIDRFIEIAGTLGVPCYPVIGNHDIYFNNWSVWRDRIGSTCYRIDDTDNTTLFVLDSANAFFGKAQLDWLEKEMKTAQSRVFLFTHSDLFVKGPVSIQQLTDTKERARIISILHDRCQMVLMGHSHTRVENKAGNIQFISIEDFKSKSVYLLVEVRNTGVTYSFRKL